MRRRLLLTTVATFAIAAPPAGAEVVIEGRGWGHGIGLSQYGAHGFAKFEQRDFRWILGHYYRGTSLGDGPSTRIRVKLREASHQSVAGATLARAANGRRVRLRSTRTYRLVRWGATGLRLVDRGRTRARLRGPVRIYGGAMTTLMGTAENERRNGAYRGVLELSNTGSRVLTVNDVHPRHYLYGVVPREMPTDWPAEAVRAQAVAARSYAVRSLRPGRPFDVFADVRSQVYGGVSAETPAGNAAVRATGNLVVRDADGVAQTFFHSTSGGRTAAVEEVWTSSDPISYLRSVEDPHDHISPVHTWTARFSESEAERKLGDLVRGDLERLEIAARTPSGRAATVRVVGSRGTREVGAAAVRTELELRSTWFSVRNAR